MFRADWYYLDDIQARVSIYIHRYLKERECDFGHFTWQRGVYLSISFEYAAGQLYSFPLDPVAVREMELPHGALYQLKNRLYSIQF